MTASSPSTLEVAAAIRCLGAAGFSIHIPGAVRLELVSAARLAELWEISQEKARTIISELPGSVRLGGGDLRARVSDLEEYLEAHPVRPRLTAVAA